MIETIESNYNLSNLSIVIINNKKYIKSVNKLYQFVKIYNPKYIMAIYEFSNKNEKYEKIILNKKNSIFTKYNEDTYILIEKKARQDKISKYIFISNKNKNILDTSEWDELWSKKIDYIEQKYITLKEKNKYIDESIYYYLGMAENAILYFKRNIKGISKNKSICRRRMNEEDYYNPLNIVVDYEARDIAEYLKENFFTKKNYDNLKISMFLENVKEKEDCLLIYCRMLFPNYFFDEYMNLIRKKRSKIKKILKRIDEYEIYVNKIYKVLKKRHNTLERIEWIKKEQC